MVPLWIPTFRCLRNVWPHRPAFHLRLGRFNEEDIGPGCCKGSGTTQGLVQTYKILQGDDGWMDGWMVCAYDLCIYKYIMWWIEFMNELYLLNLCMELELRVYAWKVCVKYNTTSIWKLYVHIHIYTLYIYVPNL
jgi:hypothetical protein